jgi:hypothetical protein
VHAPLREMIKRGGKGMRPLFCYIIGLEIGVELVSFRKNLFWDDRI